jgi:hypothetical protein
MRMDLDGRRGRYEKERRRKCPCNRKGAESKWKEPMRIKDDNDGMGEEELGIRKGALW